MRKASPLKMMAEAIHKPQRIQAPRSPRERLNVRRGLPAKYQDYMAATPTEHGKRKGGL